MEVTVLYNNRVRLEEGDIIALDKKTNRLWIRVEDKLYRSCREISKLEKDMQLDVNSAGFFSAHKDFLPKELEWVRYSNK
jgi:hypothetical protein